ncbi:MAG: PorP/SprF family type IX secretion system membrane protein [Saprospiraceae bacterium]|nr:PorP/SprF family type IX secretion system membrane protein [Saprospiraceae bacterium]
MAKHLKPSILLFFLLGVFTSDAQDIHFSQFYHNPLYLNPANTGLFSGDQRFSAIYRNQWADVPVPYTSMAGSFDEKIYLPSLNNALLTWGISFTRDEAGDGNLSWTILQASFAYVQQLADEWYLSGGVALGGGQRAFEADKLFFGDQFNGDIFDPNLITGEGFDQTSASFFSIGSGVNLYFQDIDSRSKAYFGVAGHNLNQPGFSFFNQDKVQLPMRTSIHALGVFEVNPDWDVGVQAQWQNQGPYQEMIAGAFGKLHLSQEAGEELAVRAGLGYRLGDALFIEAGVYYLNWRLVMSYDVNTSPFRVATNRRGGPEISLRHIITKVKPPDEFKSCPIF